MRSAQLVSILNKLEIKSLQCAQLCEVHKSVIDKLGNFPYRVHSNGNPNTIDIPIMLVS